MVGVRGLLVEIVGAAEPGVRPSRAWLCRVVDAMGTPIDGKGPLTPGPLLYPFRGSPAARAQAQARRRPARPRGPGAERLFDVLPRPAHGRVRRSGVGKSVLLAMLARNSDCDVAVIGLVGERGREVQEFLQDDLGDAGLARSVVVVATSDEPALKRCQAAYLTLALAEYFRDEATTCSA